MARKRVTVYVYFATNRQPMLEEGTDKIIGFSSELGPTGGLDVRYGSAEVDVDIAAKTNKIVEGSLTVADQQLLFAPGGSPKFGSKTIFDALRSEMASAKRPALAFIHGFSNSFVDAIERAGWNLVFLGIDANMFVFTWPSIASPIDIPLPYHDYEHDRGTAAASGPAVARTIWRLHDYVDSLAREDRCDQSIHLICHSMGNYVLRNALQALMRLPDPRTAGTGDVRSMMALSNDAPDPSVLRRSFDKIILAAADEDSDAFDDPLKLKYLPRIGQSVTVYHNRKDWVLNTLSAVTKFNGPRLGNDGPDNMGSINDKVSAIDVTNVDNFKDDPESHQYYRTIPIVGSDIAAVLKGTPQNQIPNRDPVGSGRWAIRRPAAKRARATVRRSRR
jgi:esterase/lipase superfamily enzyme